MRISPLLGAGNFKSELFIPAEGTISPESSIIWWKSLKRPRTRLRGVLCACHILKIKILKKNQDIPKNRYRMTMVTEYTAASRNESKTGTAFQEVSPWVHESRGRPMVWFRNQGKIVRFSRNPVRTPRFPRWHVKAFRALRVGFEGRPPYSWAAEWQNMQPLCPSWPLIGGERSSSKMFNYLSPGSPAIPSQCTKC